jgi:hypothetical protein
MLRLNMESVDIAMTLLFPVTLSFLSPIRISSPLRPTRQAHKTKAPN